MPIDPKMMANMVKQYGQKEGEKVYYAMEQKRKMMKAKIAAKKK